MNNKILIIDDEPAVHKSFTLSLEDVNCNITSAFNGQDGIDLFNKGAYDVVFLDLKMPAMNGAQVLDKIRETNQQTPVFIITAFHKEFFAPLKEIRDKGLNFEIVAKPLDSRQIIDLVNSNLSR